MLVTTREIAEASLPSVADLPGTTVLTARQVHRIGQLATVLENIFLPSAYYLAEQKIDLDSVARELRQIIGLNKEET